MCADREERKEEEILANIQRILTSETGESSGDHNWSRSQGKKTLRKMEEEAILNMLVSQVR